jgi:hypothetical protein
LVAAKSPEKTVDGELLARLAIAAQRARLVLVKPRSERLRMVREYIGAHWSEEGAPKDVPLNLLGAYCDIVGSRLVAANPRVMLSSDDPDQKPTIAAMETWANRQIERMDLANTLGRAVLDALFSIGIIKVGLATGGDAAVSNWGLLSGQPFAKCIDLDDFVFDVHARDFSECSFIGHRYRIPLRVAKKLYGTRAADLTASDDRLYNLEGDERISVLGRTTISAGDTEEFEEMVDLWEFYLPRHKLVVTLHDDQLSSAFNDNASARLDYGKALDVKPWLGPPQGPYHILGFGVVPGNAMPKAPIQDLYDLHLAVNRALRKLIREADNFKNITLYQNEEDAKRVAETPDGGCAHVENPEGVTAAPWNGPNANLFQFYGALREAFNWLAGNLDIEGGLGPQSKTATQDEMLNANSSARMNKMGDKVLAFTVGISRALCWFWHHDPFKTMTASLPVRGMPGLSVPQRATPADRQQVPFDQLDLRVDPYSLQYTTPEQKLQQLNGVVTQIVLPMMQLLVQQGIQFDLNAYLEKVGSWLHLPDLAEILTITEPPDMDSMPAQARGPGMPASTTRTYNRRSSSGPTTFGQDMQRAGAMQNGGTNGQPSMNGAA